MVLLALALPRHAPHQPPRAASSFLLRRRFAVGRRLRDRWAAAPCQLDGLLLKFLPRFFYFVRRAGPVLKKFLGDLFSFFFVADDLRGGRSFSFEILSRRRRRRRGVVTVTASARWRGGLPAGGRRVARGALWLAKAELNDGAHLSRGGQADEEIQKAHLWAAQRPLKALQSCPRGSSCVF